MEYKGYDKSFPGIKRALIMEVNTREKEEAKDLTIEFRYFRMQPVISPRKTELEMG